MRSGQRSGTADHPAGRNPGGQSPTAYRPGRYSPAGSLETSGSLTGHILAQGAADAPRSPSRTARVVVIMAVVVGLLVVSGLAAAILFSDAITNTLNQILSDR